MRWLGVLPSDIERLNIPDAQQVDLTQKDRNLAQNILDRPYCSPDLRREVKLIITVTTGRT